MCCYRDTTYKQLVFGISRSFDFALKRDQLELVLLLHDNSIEWYNIVVMEKSIESERKAWLMKSGHRTDIRSATRMQLDIDKFITLFCM